MSSASERGDFDPYRVWLGIPKSEQPPNHYRLLGIVTFEDDPQVILEGADRQVAHLKNKQTGQRVAFSQKLLQEVAAAAGCLLDPDSKAKYDETLRESQKLVELPRAPEPQIPLPQPTYAPVGYSAPAYYPPPRPQYVPAPQFVPPSMPNAPLPPAPGPQYSRPQPVPARPIPIPRASEPEESAEEDFSSEPLPAPAFGSIAVHGTRSRNASGDVVKWLVGAAIAGVLLLVAWSALSRSDVMGPMTSNFPRTPTKPAAPRQTITKPNKSETAKPDVVTPASSTKPSATQPTQGTEQPEPTKGESNTPATPSTPTTTTPITRTTNPSPMPAPVDPPTATSTIPSTTKPPVGPTSPSQPAVKSPQQKKLWRYAGGLIELDDDGTWKELTPAGDYHLLTLVSQSPAAAGNEGEVFEFHRSTGAARIRVNDDRLEMTEGGAFAFQQVATGGWLVPADELELETYQKAGLERICDTYADSLAKAHKKLLDKFDNLMSTGRKRIGKAEEFLATVAILEAEKKHFEATGFVPWSAPMRTATVDYVTELSRARTTAEAAFDKTAHQFIMKKQPEIASSILALKQRTTVPLVIAKLTKIPTPRTSAGGFRRPFERLTGPPEEPDDLPAEERSSLLRLWSNGAINMASSKSQWSFNQVNLRLQVVRSNYTLLDVITIAEAGNEFEGQSKYSNDYTTGFKGTFEFVLEPQERRPTVRFKPVESAAD